MTKEVIASTLFFFDFISIERNYKKALNFRQQLTSYLFDFQENRRPTWSGRLGTEYYRAQKPSFGKIVE
jgi:hypothetical protein